VACLALLVALAPALTLSHLRASSSSDRLLSEVSSSFAKVQTIEREGGNVTAVVGQLNMALVLISGGQSVEANDPSGAQSAYNQAEALIQSVGQQLPIVERQGIASAQSEVAWLAVTLAALTALGLTVYFRGSRIYWSLWVRAHRGWLVKKA
jgi:hypothetical protein